MGIRMRKTFTADAKQFPQYSVSGPAPDPFAHIRANKLVENVGKKQAESVPPGWLTNRNKSEYEYKSWAWILVSAQHSGPGFRSRALPLLLHKICAFNKGVPTAHERTKWICKWWPTKTGSAPATNDTKDTIFHIAHIHVDVQRTVSSEQWTVCVYPGVSCRICICKHFPFAAVQFAFFTLDSAFLVKGIFIM